jgi:hypothetical protein
MNEFQTRYALAKLLPELASGGCIIKTANHEISLTATEAKKLRKQIYTLLKSRLENKPAHGGTHSGRGQASQMGRGASNV